MPIQLEAYEEANRSGWLPRLAAVPGDESSAVTRGNKYLKLAGYIGGRGDEPTDNVGEYLGEDGYVAVQAQATDISRYSGEELAQYLRDVGFTIELPIVTDEQNGCVLGVQGGRWVAAKDIRATLRESRLAAEQDREADSLLLPDPSAEAILAAADEGEGYVVPVYSEGDDSWTVRDFRGRVASANSFYYKFSRDVPATGDRLDSDNGRVMTVIDGFWNKGYRIEVVDSLPGNPDSNTLYFERTT